MEPIVELVRRFRSGRRSQVSGHDNLSAFIVVLPSACRLRVHHQFDLHAEQLLPKNPPRRLCPKLNNYRESESVSIPGTIRASRRQSFLHHSHCGPFSPSLPSRLGARSLVVGCSSLVRSIVGFISASPGFSRRSPFSPFRPALGRNRTAHCTVSRVLSYISHIEPLPIGFLLSLKIAK